MKFIRFTVVLFMAALLPSISHSIDLGVKGQVYERTEIDLRLIAMKEMAETDWDKVNAAKEDDIKAQLENMAYTVHLPPVEELVIRDVDMSIVLQQDMTAPIKMPDGSFQWKTLGRAGDKINPFEMVQPIEKFFFFDPDSIEQLKFAESLLKSGMVEDRYINLVATGGDILAANEKLGAVGYAYPYIVEGFRVSRNMSFVYLPTGSKLAKVVELSEKTKITELNEIINDARY